jgi:lipopolysaccharide transport system ATP-binding protein
MAEPIISIHDLGKKYTLGSQDSFLAIRDSVTSIFDFNARKSQAPKEFWALKDVSCDIMPGESIGIVGRNGAGKSTLLKILSQITPPTTGHIRMHGRVASLLEVGTGFHLELTGRENIYLNGAILGMTRQEIKRNFDEIVAFAEIDKFLDTPVKRYSSGMYVRLAFSVAAHLQSEILIVDEVLAVGDRQFQKKCLGKMEEVGKQGRTVIFVSHNMAVINELCQRSILLDKGLLKDFDKTEKIISTYLAQGDVQSDAYLDLTPPELHKNKTEKSLFSFESVAMRNSLKKASTSIQLMESFEIEIHGKLEKKVEDLSLGVTVNSSLGYPVFNAHITSKDQLAHIKAGKVQLKLHFDPNIFGPGMYTLGLNATGTNVVDWVPDIMTFTVEQFNDRKEVSLHPDYDGVVIYPYNWSIEQKK